jgi:transcriptional regulator with XRE-family HTH domain
MPNTTIATTAPPPTLREAIARSGLTDDQIAVKVGCSKRTIAYWREGKRPRDYHIGILGKVLGCDLWAMYQSIEGAPTIQPKATTEETHLFATLVSPIEWSGQKVGKSQLSSKLDQAMKMYLVQQLAMLWDNFHNTTEESNLITHRLALSSHMQTLESLATWALPEGDRKWLLCAMCDAAILTGRIARDQLNHREAIAHHKYALKLSIESTSHNHIAASSMRLAETLWEAELLFDAISYGSVGIEQSAAANPRIRGELLGLVAQIYGNIGDLKNCERLTNAAAFLAVGASKLPTVGGINFSETAAASYQTFEALRRGDASAALIHIERAQKLLVTEFPEEHNVRWEAHLWINQSKVHQAMGEIETACSDLVHAARLAQSIASHNALRKIQNTASEMMLRYSSVPAIQALREVVLNSTLSRIVP